MPQVQPAAGDEVRDGAAGGGHQDGVAAADAVSDRASERSSEGVCPEAAREEKVEVFLLHVEAGEHGRSAAGRHVVPGGVGGMGGG